MADVTTTITYSGNQSPITRHVFQTLQSVIVVWFFGFLTAVATSAALVPRVIMATAVISLASGIVAVLAPCVGLVLARKIIVDPADRFSAYLLVAGIAMAVRLLGTVALFLLCRYQMVHSVESVAAMVLGWYVLLTTVEIVGIANAPALIQPVAVTRSAINSPSS